MDSKDMPVVLGKHEGCGGVVKQSNFPSGTNQYCTKCGNFGVERTPLASPLQDTYLIGISFEGQWTCSTNCEVKDPSDGPECRDALAAAMHFDPDTLDEVLVVKNDEVVYQHGGQEGFKKKKAHAA